MKSYSELEDALKNILVDIVSEDSYGLSPETLYYNIQRSSGTPESLSSIFGVSEELIVLIKEQF